MSNLLRFPHGLLRRHLATVERLIVAAGLAATLYGLMHSLPAYPPYWDVVLCVLVFGLTMWSPLAGYLLAVLAAAFPIYNLSLYLAVLFLAVALLGVRAFANNLGATIMVLLTPWLGPFYLFWVTPILGGLWWGAVGGAVIGGMAALWGQLLAGMAGQSPDWLARLGTAPGAAAIVENFAGADSMQTLLRILSPLTPDSTALLYYLLQVILWSLVGGMVGSLVERPWAQNRRPWASILIGWAGVLALLVGHIIPVLWFGMYDQSVLAGLWMPLFISLALTALLVGIFESMQDLLEHPLPSAHARRRTVQPANRPSRRLASTPPPVTIPSSQPSTVPPSSAASEQNEEDEDDDLIMLELE